MNILATNSRLLWLSALLLVHGCSLDKQYDEIDADDVPAEIAQADYPYDCLAVEIYDEQEDACYLDCTGLSDLECDALEADTYDDYAELVDAGFSGPAGERHHDEAAHEEPIAKYAVEADLSLNEVSNQQPENGAAFEQIWMSVLELLPHTVLKREVRYFSIDSDGKDETLAFVTQDEEQIDKWVFSIDPLDYVDGRGKEFIHTAIHEFGHLVFLGNQQVDVFSTEPCATFEIDEGCTAADSWLNMYYQRFWTSISDEHAAAMSAYGDGDDEAILKFYRKYQASMISEYAATDAVEDIAEVFTHFVLKEKPSGVGSIIEQKLLMMYDFAELVKLRKLIRGKLKAR